MPSNTIWVEFRGKRHTLFEVAKILNISYPTIYSRYRSGKALDDPYENTQSTGAKDSTLKRIEQGYKPCGNCLEIKNFAEFHKCASSSDGVHSICKKCRGKKQYQKLLEAKLLFQDAKNIRNCVKCDDLFCIPHTNTYLCRECRREARWQ